jgi:hypothetical protein
MSRLTTALGALTVAAALAVAPAAASAADTHEPNNGIETAWGPVPGNTSIAADFGSINDDDFYLLRVSGTGTLTVNVNNVRDSTGCELGLYLLDENGDEIRNITVDDGVTNAKLQYSTAGESTFYLQAMQYQDCDDRPGSLYRISVGGADGLAIAGGAGSATAQSTPNASHTASTAFGPLTGGALYENGLVFDGEQDWFSFYTSGPGPVDVALTNSGQDDAACLWFGLYDETGADLAGRVVYKNHIGHIRFTAPGARKYLVRTNIPSGYACYGANVYRLQVDGPLTSTPAPPLDTDGDGIPDVSDSCPEKAGVGDGCQVPSKPVQSPQPAQPKPAVETPGSVRPGQTTPSVACAAGKASVRRWTSKLRKASRTLASARSKARKRGLSSSRRRALKRQVKSAGKQVAAARKSLRKAQAKTRRYC